MTPEIKTPPRVAFQGERGAYSEEAAVALLGEDIQLVPRPTLESLFASVSEGVADYALTPMENSLAGSVQRCYDLLRESPLQITAEVVIPIAHCLIGCPGSSFESITAGAVASSGVGAVRAFLRRPSAS
jgi:prephenate dehydratase